ncbi:MAG: inorganic diphosphatase [Chlorobi bacterium]|nr:inorganic diphosphatase [Chlorobiota bacterium]
MSKQPTGLEKLDAVDPESGDFRVIVETPQGSRNKYTYNADLHLFELGGVLPVGAVFPFDFGFIPSTIGEDGDPLDVLLLMDVPAFPGCMVAARLIGVIEAEQTERDATTVRNDRLIAVAVQSRTHQDVRNIGDLNDALIDEIVHFFVSYNEIKGKIFKPIGRHASFRARAIVEAGMKGGGGKAGRGKSSKKGT